MIQFNVLSGRTAGTLWAARRLPVRIGRTAASDLQLEEDGVWDQHAELDLHREEGFLLAARADALLTVNGQPMPAARLRNGDLVQIGSVRLQFWLAPTRQRGLRLREWFIWALVAGISLLEVAVVYSLL